MTATDQNDTDTQIIRYGDEFKPTQTMKAVRRRRRTGCHTRSGTVALVALVLVLLTAIAVGGSL